MVGNDACNAEKEGQGKGELPEIIHAGCLVLPGQAALIAFSIAGDVESVLGLQLLELGLDGIPASPCTVGPPACCLTKSEMLYL